MTLVDFVVFVEISECFLKEDHVPTRILSLSRAQLARHLAAARQLRASGIDVEIPEDLLVDSHALDIQIAPPYVNIIRQLAGGTVAYAIWIRLVALRPNVILEYSQLASGWDQDLFQISANEKGLYYLGRGFEFTRAEVLNHLIEERHCFHRRGDSVEGWLLATGLEPIPDAYRNNTSVPVDVSFTDQFGVDCVSPAYALMERSAHYKAPTLRKRNSAGLYAPNLRSESIGENKVSTPSCRNEDTAPARAPVSRLREQAPGEDSWDRSSS
jgi:hypothetical protein